MKVYNRPIFGEYIHHSQRLPINFADTILKKRIYLKITDSVRYKESLESI